MWKKDCEGRRCGTWSLRQESSSGTSIPERSVEGRGCLGITNMGVTGEQFQWSDCLQKVKIEM